MPITADDPLYRLLAWSSPAYPIGAYSYSHGLEWAVESGLLRDRADVVAWLGGVLADGAGKVDGAFFAAAWHAATKRDDAEFDEIAALAPSVAAAAVAAIAADLDELGSAVPMVDWCSMRHETQYTRLFRS